MISKARAKGEPKLSSIDDLSNLRLSSPIKDCVHLVRFCPSYYLRRYLDVASAAVDPLTHYRMHGWREGRDPSPLFSTNYYIENYGTGSGSAASPLDHYLEKGREAGHKPHPLYRDVLVAEMHIGIVTVVYNCSDIAALTVTSVSKARTDLRVTYFLIDGGSSPEEKTKIRSFCDHFVPPDQMEVEFVDLDRNLGYSGSNNVGIQRALAAGCDYVCLLNPDVVVTDYWLERMIDEGEPCVSPVCNSVGNEQTVPVDYSVSPDLSSFKTINDFAQKWASAFKCSYETTSFIGFFCALLNSEAIRAVGLLDDTFYPGGYEDIDYCVRLRQASVELVVARHIYVHHWGSASFSTLPMDQRVAHADTNRKRYEQKHGMFWIDWKLSIFRSALSDFRRAHSILPAELKAFQHSILDRHMAVCDALLPELADDTIRLRREIEKRDVLVASLEKSIKIVDDKRLRLIDIVYDLDPNYALPSEVTRAGVARVVTAHFPVEIKRVLERQHVARDTLYANLFYLIMKALVAQQRPFFWALKLALPLIDELAHFLSEPPVIILACVDPVNGDERDGYVQRVLAIDQSLCRRPRLYVKTGASTEDGYRLTIHPDGIAILDIHSDDVVYTAILCALFQFGCFIYTHSVLAVSSPGIRQAIADSSLKLILDVHGVVPEEFVMNDDRVNAIIFEKYENELMRRADAIVCVSQSMVDHLESKYSGTIRKSVLCPIFADSPARAVRVNPAEHKPRLIYAGGTQIWQKIDDMARLVVALRGQIDYLFLSPHPDIIRAALREAKVPEWELMRNVRAASHKEVLREYRSSDYGLILRSDFVVNRVACPTKLIEYITHGVVPIVEAASIGDFAALGMQFLKAGELSMNAFPSEPERQEMVQRNFEVLDILRGQSRSGMQTLEKIFDAV